MTPQQPDVAGAVLALDQAMIALAVAKSTLLGETSRPVPLASLRDREHYDPEYLAKCYRQEAHGFPPLAEGDPPRWNCDVTDHHGVPPGHYGVPPFPRFPHLPQHAGGNPVCIICGIDHDAAARLAPPAPYGHQSLQPQDAS